MLSSRFQQLFLPDRAGRKNRARENCPEVSNFGFCSISRDAPPSRPCSEASAKRCRIAEGSGSATRGKTSNPTACQFDMQDRLQVPKRRGQQHRNQPTTGHPDQHRQSDRKDKPFQPNLSIVVVEFLSSCGSTSCNRVPTFPCWYLVGNYITS